MRKLFSVFLFLSVSAGVVSAAPVDNTKYLWSYAAVADVINDMYKYCSHVELPELTKHGDFLASKNAYASKAELAQKCILDAPYFDVIDMNKKTCKEHMIIPGTIYSVRGKKSDGCNLFLTNIIDRQAKIKKQYSSPGTYVRMGKLTNGRSVYIVNNVVLAPGYRDAKGNTNFNVNTNDANTHIYVFNGDKYVRTGKHTWTNDMFMNIQNGNGDKGMIRGARVGAYIYYNEDMTSVLYNFYNERRGKIGGSVANGYDSSPGNRMDIKEHLRDKFIVRNQTKGEADGNGFLFRGKIATLDFLGNVLYGMNVQEASLPNRVGDALAEGVSLYSSKDSHWYKLWQDGENESQWVKTGWQVGKTLVSDMKRQRSTKFASVQTKTPQQAYDMAAAELKRMVAGAKNINCAGNCKWYGGDDVVSCVYSGGVMDFVFDDICD